MSDPRITDEVAFAALGAFEAARVQRGLSRLEALRAALEVALPHIAPRPVVDREALKAVLDRRLHGEQVVDLIMALVRPMPTQEQIAKAFHDDDENHAWLSESCVDHGCEQRYRQYADLMLALLNGTES